MAHALVSASELIEAARSAQVPILYVTTVHDSVDSLPLLWRPEYVGEIAYLTLRGAPGCEINPTVASRPGDVVLEKVHASGFFGTGLEDRLRSLGVDTVLLVSTGTSGCIRATAVDAVARSFFVQVVEECVDDSRFISGIVALNDVAERYGDVVTLTSTLEYLAELAAA